MHMNLFERIKTIRAKLISNNKIKAETEMLDSQHRIKLIIIANKNDLKILDIKAKMTKVPYKICLKTAPKIKKLKGVKIQEGFYNKVKDAIGGPEGCMHLIDLIMDTARGVFQASLKIEARGLKIEEQRQVLMERLKDSCLGYKKKSRYEKKEAT